MIPIRDDIEARRKPLINLALIAATIAFFFFQYSSPEINKTLIWNASFIPNAYRNFQTPLWTVVSYAGLHGGLLHLAGNLWSLWIFGDNVEDKMGRVRYFWFYILSAIAAALVHMALNPNSSIPTVGASGAISGVMGAYLVYFPRARILTVVPIFIFLHFMRLPAVVFLGIWFLLQFLSGSSSALANVSGGVAWWAHIGGFLFGVVTAKLFEKRNR